MAGLTRRAVAATLAAGILLLSACSEDADVLDREATQAEVAEAVARPVGDEVESVRCPDPIVRREGLTTTCRVVVAGVDDQLRVEVEQTDDRGSLTVDLLDVVVHSDRLESDMAEALGDQLGRPIEVDCTGPKVRVVEVGGGLECDALDGTSQRAVRATVEDAAGTMSYLIHG